MQQRQQQVIGECLRAAAEGPFFPDWEFHTLFGLERDEIARIAAAWPDVAHHDNVVQLAVNNAIGNLIGYPIDAEREWPHHISVCRTELEAIFEEWRNSVK